MSMIHSVFALGSTNAPSYGLRVRPRLHFVMRQIHRYPRTRRAGKDAGRLSVLPKYDGLSTHVHAAQGSHRVGFASSIHK